MDKIYSSKAAFLDWDKTASVRSRPRRELTRENVGNGYFFPPEYAPFLEHPLLAKLNEDTKSIVLIHQLYTYLNFTEYLEHEAICVVAYNISMQNYEFKLTQRLCKDARKIYVDEIYHWMFSIDFAEEVEYFTGVKRLSENEPRFLRSLNNLTKSLTEKQKHLSLLFFTTVAETLITPTMGKLPHDIRLVLPVRELIEDHTKDEQRHLRYFIELFHLLWDHIDTTDRHVLCILLPKMLYSYFEPDYDRITQLLKSLSFSDDQIRVIINDTYQKDKIRDNIMISSFATIKLFHDVGMFDSISIRDAFINEGIIV